MLHLFFWLTYTLHYRFCYEIVKNLTRWYIFYKCIVRAYNRLYVDILTDLNMVNAL